MKLRRAGLRATAAVGLAFALAMGLVQGTQASTVHAVSQAKSPIIICQDVALSGTFSFLGDDDVTGVTAWLHAHPTIMGHPWKIVTENSQSIPSLAASLATKCVDQDHTNFIFGPEESSSGAAVIPTINSLKIVDLGWWSPSWPEPGNSLAASRGWAFPGIADASLSTVQALFNQVIVPHHYTRIAVLSDNAPFGSEFIPDSQVFAKKNHLTFVGSQIFAAGATDITPQVLNLLSDNPQFILMGTVPGTDTVTGLKAIRAQSATVPVGFDGGGDVSSFVSALGASNMTNVYTSGSTFQAIQFLPKGAPERATTLKDDYAFLANMKDVGYTTPDTQAAGGEGWDTMEELTAAITAAGSFNEAKVKAALQVQHIDTLGAIWARTPQNYLVVNAYSPLVTYNQTTGEFNVVKATAAELKTSTSS